MVFFSVACLVSSMLTMLKMSWCRLSLFHLHFHKVDLSWNGKHLEGRTTHSQGQPQAATVTLPEGRSIFQSVPILTARPFHPCYVSRLKSLWRAARFVTYPGAIIDVLKGSYKHRNQAPDHPTLLRGSTNADNLVCFVYHENRLQWYQSILPPSQVMLLRLPNCSSTTQQPPVVVFETMEPTTFSADYIADWI